MIDLQIDKRIFIDALYPYLNDYSHRYEVYKGGAGSGKSYFIAQKLVLKALKSQRKMLIMRKVGATLRDSVWQQFIDVLQQFQIYDKCTINKSNFTIELPNDSAFLFRGLDDSEKIKSITGVTDVFVEEATEFELQDIIQLNLRLRANTKQNQMLFAFNPISKSSWVYEYFLFDNENETQSVREYDKTIVLSTTFKDNKFAAKEFIQSLEQMKNIDYVQYQIYTLGKFCSLDKLVYTNWTSQAFDWKEIKRKDNTTAIFGMDFGYVNDSTAFICSVVDEERKEIYVFDEHFEKSMLNTDIAEMIKKKGFAKEEIVADSAERKSIDEIKRLGIPRIKPAKKGKGSILQGIQKLQQYKIIVHPSCTNIIEELQNYSWKKDKNGEYINEPVDKFNHGLDALRYSIQSIKKKPKLINIRL
ncbi:MAG: PBSX family phage terminase large subunit [Sedimentibacter sp.]|uniref:PBSX family phage terminase large subunit n=1 Tax=Sedimentibacter sp. TaxID=1960295 RepID=UPI003158BA9C